jgi:hypothetical protein
MRLSGVAVFVLALAPVLAPGHAAAQTYKDTFRQAIVLAERGSAQASLDVMWQAVAEAERTLGTSSKELLPLIAQLMRTYSALGMSSDENRMRQWAAAINAGAQPRSGQHWRSSSSGAEASEAPRTRRVSPGAGLSGGFGVPGAPGRPALGGSASAAGSGRSVAGTGGAGGGGGPTGGGGGTATRGGVGGTGGAGGPGGDANGEPPKPEASAGAAPPAAGEEAASGKKRGVAKKAAPASAGSAAPPQDELPLFPSNPPKPSAQDTLAPDLLRGYTTFGDASDAILDALRGASYVDWSFFRTAGGGVALVTKLERIKPDGTPDTPRFATQTETTDLFSYLRGLFFLPRGRYRVIVFVMQDTSVRPGTAEATREETDDWLKRGLRNLPERVRAQPFRSGQCDVLIYEFESVGDVAKPAQSDLGARQHLERAGIKLAAQGRR